MHKKQHKEEKEHPHIGMHKHEHGKTAMKAKIATAGKKHKKK